MDNTSASLDDDESRELRRAAGARLIAMLEKLQAVEPRITLEEIEAELAAYYAEKAAQKSESGEK